MKAPFRSIVPNRKNEPIVTYSRVMFPLLVETGGEGECNWRRKNTGSGLVGRRAKNGRANKARFVERAGRSSSKLQRACAWSRDTDNVLRIDLIRVANQISNWVHLSLSHYGDDSRLYRLVNGIQYRNTDRNRSNRVCRVVCMYAMRACGWQFESNEPHRGILGRHSLTILF